MKGVLVLAPGLVYHPAYLPPDQQAALRDAVVMGGAARLAFHGIDRVLGGTSTLLPAGGRINLTLRKVRRGDDG